MPNQIQTEIFKNGTEIKKSIPHTFQATQADLELCL